MSDTVYELSNPLTGMSGYNCSSFLVKADATASSYLANTTGKLYLTAELNATMAGATLNLNSPLVLAIGVSAALRSEWKNNDFHFAGNLADSEAAAAKAAMAKTKSAATSFDSAAAKLKTKTTQLANEAEMLGAYTFILEG